MAQQFPSIRDVPQTDVPQWQSDLLNQLKEAVEILAGQRIATRAVMSADIAAAVQQANNITMTRVTTTISGGYVQSEALAVAQNLQDLSQNVVSLQNQVNALIKALGA